MLHAAPLLLLYYILCSSLTSPPCGPSQHNGTVTGWMINHHVPRGKLNCSNVSHLFRPLQFPAQFPWCTSWAERQTPSLSRGLSRTGPTETSWSTSLDTMTRYFSPEIYLPHKWPNWLTAKGPPKNVLPLCPSGFRRGQRSQCVQWDQHGDHQPSDPRLHLRLPDQSSQWTRLRPLQQHRLLHHAASGYKSHTHTFQSRSNPAINTQVNSCDWSILYTRNVLKSDAI